MSKILLERLEEAESKIVKKLESFQDSFDKHGKIELELFQQNNTRIDKLTETTNAMKKEYREKFKKIEFRMLLVSAIVFIPYLIELITFIINKWIHQS